MSFKELKEQDKQNAVKTRLKNAEKSVYEIDLQIEVLSAYLLRAPVRMHEKIGKDIASLEEQKERMLTEIEVLTPKLDVSD